MSRTFGLSTPSRRSKRLLQNGYYKVEPSDVISLLEANSSDGDDDDTASVDSNLSRISQTSDNRRIDYKESPPHHVFNRSRRRNNSGSPTRAISTMPPGLLNQTAAAGMLRTHQNTHFQRHIRKKITETTSTRVVNTQDNNAAGVFGTISAPAMSAPRRELQRRDHTIPHLYSFENADDPEVADSNNLGAGEHVRHADLERRIPENKRQKVFTGTGDQGTFKIPPPRASPSDTEPVSASDGLSFSDDEERFEEQTYAADYSFDEYLKKLVLFFFHIIQLCVSYFAAMVWEAGRYLYQYVTKLLVLDTWLFSAEVDASSVYRKVPKLAQLFLYLFAFFVGALILYLGVPLLLNGETGETWDFMDSPISYFSTVKKSLPRGESSPESEYQSSEMMKKSLQKLEFSLRELELRIADRHSSVLQNIETSQSKFAEELRKVSQSHREILSTVEVMITRALSEEIARNNELFQNKLNDLEIDLSHLRTNNTRTINNLLIQIDQREMTSTEGLQQMSEKLNGFEKRFVSLDNKAENLRQDYSSLKSSVERHAGNITFLRELSNEQFLENFLILLQKGSSSTKQEEHRRHQYLALVFLEWLQKRGFLQESTLVKMHEQILKNSSNLENTILTELEKRLDVLRKPVTPLVDPTQMSSITLDSVVSQQRSDSAPSKISEALIKTWIQEALAIYSADRIGIPDFALESSGGSVVNTRCSETYQHKKALVSILGIPIYYNINTPRAIIQPTVMPGECWAFKGAEGFIVISLSATIHPTAFTLEHIPKSLALNNISSAPKDFTVYGLEQANDIRGIHLGSYRYEESGPPIQHFKMDKAYEQHSSFNHIELRVASNWGHPKFTCLYRFRVHGRKAK